MSKPGYSLLLSGLVLGAAWLVPGTVLGALLEWSAVALFTVGIVRGVHTSLAALLYLTGILTYGIPMYWFPQVVAKFAQHTELVGFLIAGLYVVIAAFQFVCFGMLFRLMPRITRQLGCSAACAWVVTELAASRIKLFPWQLGALQIGFLPFAQVAEVGGIFAISFLMLWTCEGIIRAVDERRKAVVILPLCTLFVTCFIGAMRIRQFHETPPRTIRAALVQADPRALENPEKHFEEMTKQISPPPDLVVWPQNILKFPVNESVGDRRAQPLLPELDSRTSLILGATTHRRPVKYFSSAVLIRGDGKVPVPYHKQMLVPFGEYVPFVEFLPWLQALNPAARNAFTRGRGPVIFDVPLPGASPARVAPLVCYEDLFPQLARSAVLNGAELLVDVGGGFWSDAPLPLEMHNLVASFRSIENRRALLRSAGFGRTAVVGPTGEILRTLPFAAEGVAEAQVPLFDDRTIYSVAGDLPWWIGAVVLGVLILLELRSKSSSRNTTTQ